MTPSFSPSKVLSLVAILCCTVLTNCTDPLAAQETLPHPASAAEAGVQRLTLEEARERALANSKVLTLASLNVESKDYAMRATRADYFPKVVGSEIYFHFDEPLGTVVSTRGLTKLGAPATIAVNVINQNQSLTTVGVAQPITALLKIRQGVIIARADEKIAQADLEKGRRAVLLGVEQLYWGLMAAQRIRAGAQAAVDGAEALAKNGSLEARTASREAKQGARAATNQVTDLQEQLNSLLDQPLCTKLELVVPALPTAPVACADEAIAAALASSPEVREDEQNVIKAGAGICAAKVDYIPSVNVIGGYANQQGIPTIQPNIGYLGIQGSYTFFEWGKRRHTVHEREALLAMAQQKLAQTQDDVRLKAQKAYREFGQDAEALRDAEEMVQLRTEAVKKAADPAAALVATKALGQAEVDLVKADLAYRTAHATLMSLIGR
jgi:outer membrane protein TolC